MQLNKSQAILSGIISSLFFSVTFVVNRLMSLKGGSWVWGSSLRFYWMLPFFLLIVWYKGGLSKVMREIKRNLSQWMIWSTVGFGLFYAPLTFAASYSPAWLLASTWQFTIIAGIILSLFIYKNTDGIKHNYIYPALFSGIILLGIGIMQIRQAQSLSPDNVLKGVIPVLVAAFAYPLGNRKVMQLTNGRLNVYQRILGMIICSIPFWLILSVYEGIKTHSLPEQGQYLQTFVVAVFSGVLATVLFFSATDSVHTDQQQLAAVEATQAAEVLFSLAGEVLILSSALPDFYAVTGITLVMAGMILHSLRKTGS